MLQGKVVSFKNCLILLTSNAGSHLIDNGGQSLGFSFGDEEDDDSAYDNIRTAVLDSMKSVFAPEFLNRLDETIVFRQLE